MLIHSACGTNVLLNLGENFNILGTFGIGKTLTVGVLNIVQKTTRLGEPHFYCPSCEKEVAKATLICNCYKCGKELTVDTSYIKLNCGGIYCRTHAVELFGADNITLLLLPISKLTQG